MYPTNSFCLVPDCENLQNMTLKQFWVNPYSLGEVSGEWRDVPIAKWDYGKGEWKMPEQYNER